jgi:transporter family protein
VDKASLLLVAVFAVAFLGVRPAPRQWIGFALIAAGVLTLGWRR